MTTGSSNVVKMVKPVSEVEQVKALIDKLNFDELKEVSVYWFQIIKEQQDEELSNIDKQMAELQARRNAITGSNN